VLSARNLHKHYGPLPVLRGIDLEIPPGQVVALVGGSGAGKSTLLQIVGTLDAPTQGEVLFEGRNLFTQTERQLTDFRNRSLGFVFQFHHLLAEFTAAENVAMPALIQNQPKKPALARAAELLTTLGLGERLHHRPTQLSGGEQQRVAVARALMNNPKLILADEPTGNLDTANSNALFKLFTDLAQSHGVAFLIATHNEQLAAAAHRCLRIQDGKLV
jgi:lipoprotein-releasing system ATP-binding protein